MTAFAATAAKLVGPANTRVATVEATLTGALSSSVYRPTIAEAITDLAVGTYFESNDTGAVTTHPNTRRVYKRIVGSPFYQDIGPGAVNQDELTAVTVKKPLLTRIGGVVRNVIQTFSATGGRDFILVDDTSKVWIPDLQFLGGQTSVIDSRALALVNKNGRPVSALAAFAMADYRPVDFVFGAGDSHTEKDGYGTFGAFCKALVGRYTMHATWFSQVGHTGGAFNPVQRGGVFDGSASTGAPTELEALMYPQQGPNYNDTFTSTNNYGFIADAVTVAATSVDKATYVVNITGVDVNASWRCDYYMGTFPASYSGAGTVTLAARKMTTFSTIKTQAFSSKTGAFGRTIASLTVDADPARNEGIEFKYRLSGANAVGPLMAYGARAVNLNATKGISCHVLDSRGGQSFYDFAYQATTVMTDAQLIAFYSVVRSRQVEMGWKPIIVVAASSGHNDRNEAFQAGQPQNSLGWRASTVGDSAAAYIDNAEAWIKRVRDIWKMAGWSEDELYFMIFTSQRVPATGARDAELDAYGKISEPHFAGQARVTYVEWQNLTTAAESASYPNDGLHYTTSTGYDFIVSRVTALIPGFGA